MKVYVNLEAEVVLTEKQFDEMIKNEMELAREDYLEEYLDDLGIEEVQDEKDFEDSLWQFVTNDLGYNWMPCYMELDD